jgi:hypothetical protein
VFFNFNESYNKKPHFKKGLITCCNQILSRIFWRVGVPIPCDSYLTLIEGFYVSAAPVRQFPEVPYLIMASVLWQMWNSYAGIY